VPVIHVHISISVGYLLLPQPEDMPCCGDRHIILLSFIISLCYENTQRSFLNTEIEGGCSIGERGGIWGTRQYCVLTAWQGGAFMCRITMELRSCCQVGILVWMLISFSFVSILLCIH
jgi:hypothetical protein